MIHRTKLKDYTPYLEDFHIDIHYIKEDSGQGVQVWLYNKQHNFSRKKMYANKAFENGTINLEQIKAIALLQVFEDFKRAVEDKDVTKKKSILQLLLDLFKK